MNGMKTRKDVKEYRSGNLVDLVDAIQRFTDIQHEKDFWLFGKSMHDEGAMNPKYQDELHDIMGELQLFDITKIGNLYLTSGGRIVLDKGWGEYFGDGDTTIFTLDELTSGMNVKSFFKKVKETIDDRRGRDGNDTD